MSYKEQDGRMTIKDEFNDKLVASIREVNQDLLRAMERRTGLGLEYLNLRVTYLEDRKITEETIKVATAEIEALRKQKRQLIAAAKALGLDVGALLDAHHAAVGELLGDDGEEDGATEGGGTDG